MKTESNRVISALGVLLLTFFLLLSIYSNYNSRIYQDDMSILLLSYIPFAIIFLFVISKVYVKILHPFGMISVLYLLIFIVAPMALISSGDSTCHGDMVMDGCGKGTIIFLLSYLFFSIGYACTHINVQENKICNNKHVLTNKSNIFGVIMLLWMIGCISCCYYIYKSSFAFTFLLGGNEAIVERSNAGLKFLASFAYFMIFPCLMLSLICKRKAIVYPIVGITVLLFLLRGTRIFLLIILAAYIIMYVRKHNVRIKGIHVIVGIVAFVAMITAVGSNRKTVKGGGEESMTFTSEDVVNTMVTNFDIYKPYYGLVANCPEYYDYSYGKGIFYDTFIALIPRFVWKNKPEEEEMSMSAAIKNTTGEGPIRAAMSWPCIAEFYMDFGVLGVLLFSFLYGRIMKKSIRLLNSGNIFDVMTYGVLLPTFFQLIIRGYTPINFIMYICLFLPYFIIKPKLKRLLA